MRINRYTTTLGLILSLLGISTSEGVLISVKSLGMGGVGIGYAQDAMAAAHNPGSAASIGNRLDLGVTFTHLDGHVKNHGSLLGPLVDGTFDAYHKPKNFWSPNFGINYNLNCDWTVGVVVYNRDLSKTTYRKPFFLLGTTPPGIEYVNETISPYVAYHWGCHNFGISFNWQVQRLKLDGFQNFDNTLRSIEPGHVTNKGYNYSNGLGITFGWYWQVTDTLNIGATYQPETKMSRLKKYNGFLAHHGRFDIPQKIGVGLSWRFLECATFAFDYEFIDWKQNKGVSNSLLDDGVLNLLGANDGPGFGWKSKSYYRCGIDYAFTDNWILRAGYRYAETQIQRSQTALNAFTLEPLVEHILTIGATWYINCNHEVDFFAGYGLPNRLHGKNSIPEGLGGGNSDLYQEIWAAGFSYGFAF